MIAAKASAKRTAAQAHHAAMRPVEPRDDLDDNKVESDEKRKLKCAHSTCFHEVRLQILMTVECDRPSARP